MFASLVALVGHHRVGNRRRPPSQECGEFGNTWILQSILLLATAAAVFLVVQWLACGDEGQRPSERAAAVGSLPLCQCSGFCRGAYGKLRLAI
jgi:hypothetical protein